MKYVCGGLLILLLLLFSPIIIGMAFHFLFIFGIPLLIFASVIGIVKLMNFLYLNSFGG